MVCQAFGEATVVHNILFFTIFLLLGLAFSYELGPDTLIKWYSRYIHTYSAMMLDFLFPNSDMTSSNSFLKGIITKVILSNCLRLHMHYFCLKQTHRHSYVSLTMAAGLTFTAGLT